MLAADVRVISLLIMCTQHMGFAIRYFEEIPANVDLERVQIFLEISGSPKKSTCTGKCTKKIKEELKRARWITCYPEARVNAGSKFESP